MKKALIAIILMITLLFSGSAFAVTDAETVESCKELLDIILGSVGKDEDHFYYDIVCNESGFIIYIARNDAFVVAAAVKTGIYDYEIWESYTASIVEWASSLQAVIEACGIENSNLLFVMLDEWNHEEELLVIYNGSVIYSYIPLK